MNEVGISLDTVWMLLAAMLVFWMQPGFALCEAGFTVRTLPIFCLRTLSISCLVRYCSFS